MEVCIDDNDSTELAPLFQLSWEYIWLAEILPYLELEDNFRLRATCKAGYILVNNHFASLRRLDIENKRNFTLEAFQVNLVFKNKQQHFLRQMTMSTVLSSSYALAV